MSAEAYTDGFIAGGIDGMKIERDRIIELSRKTWNELGAQKLGSVEFHDGIGYGIEQVLIAIMGEEAYSSWLTGREATK